MLHFYLVLNNGIEIQHVALRINVNSCKNQASNSKNVLTIIIHSIYVFYQPAKRYTTRLF